MELPKYIVQESFQDIFDHLIENEKVNKSNSTVNLLCMKIHNKDFNIDSLIDKLSNSIVSYCLSQNDYDELSQKGEYGTMYRRAARLFRNYTSNKGEIGEVILYSLLESHLKAPKILSKMKLKTSTNDYVKRADGIHMLKIDEENYELIFGESKMYENLNNGIKDAINSIHELESRSRNNIVDEIDLICTNVSSEFAKENYELIKKIIKPSKNNDFEYDIAFGVFVGFEIKIDKYISLSGPEFKKKIKEKVTKDILDKMETVRSEIKRLNLQNYNLYIYFIPFLEIDKTRTNIIKELTT